MEWFTPTTPWPWRLWRFQREPLRAGRRPRRAHAFAVRVGGGIQMPLSAQISIIYTICFPHVVFSFFNFLRFAFFEAPVCNSLLFTTHMHGWPQKRVWGGGAVVAFGQTQAWRFLESPAKLRILAICAFWRSSKKVTFFWPKRGCELRAVPLPGGQLRRATRALLWGPPYAQRQGGRNPGCLFAVHTSMKFGRRGGGW